MFSHLGNLLIWIISIEHIHLALYIGFVIAILVSEKTPESMVAWIFTITVFPIFGFVLYIIFGVNWRKSRVTVDKKGKRRTTLLNSFSGEFMKYDPTQLFESKELRVKNLEKSMKNANINEEEKEIVKLLYESERTYLTNSGSYELFYDGKEAWKEKFLNEITRRDEARTLVDNSRFRIVGLPFFNEKISKEVVKEKLREINIDTEYRIDNKYAERLVVEDDAKEDYEV